MINLKKGGIYYYKTNYETNNFESLMHIKSIRQEPSEGVIVATSELATTNNLSEAFRLHGSNLKNFIKRVPLKDLPLYIYMKNKSPEFMGLIKRGPQ
jgi:hypothetical protein